MRYSGLVVGGPWAGRRVDHDKNMIYVPIEGGEVLYNNGVRAVYQPNLTFRYIFVTRYWTPYNERDGVRDVISILEVLEECYVENANAPSNNMKEHGND